MLAPTNSEQREQSNGGNSTKEQNKVTYSNEEIEGAKPFKLVGNEEQGYCITFGKFRVSEIYTTRAEALAELKYEPWTITINLIAAIFQQLHEVGQDIKK